ncbi:uncharacterized protein LOC113475796 [Ciona intestinalis]
MAEPTEPTKACSTAVEGDTGIYDCEKISENFTDATTPVVTNDCRKSGKTTAGYRERTVMNYKDRRSTCKHTTPISLQKRNREFELRPPFLQPVVQPQPNYMQSGRILPSFHLVNQHLNQCGHGLPCSYSPHIGHPIQHSPNFGLVTATEVYGTTFYRYERPVFEGPFPNGFPIIEDLSLAHTHHHCGGNHPHVRPTTSILHPQDSFTPPQSRNSLSSATPNPSSLSSSSRSSSPFLHSHSDSTRDSGIISTESTDEDVPFVLTERRRDIAFEKLLQKILTIAEDTLSNEKLTKDLYLLRQMRRNSQGYVSLKLVASVKAIKKLTSDYNTVVLALRKSNKLEVNKSATKVRRKDALPEKHVAASKEPSSLVVVGLPEVKATIESVISKYKEFGTIAQVRILSPKRPIPAYLQAYVAALPYLGQMWCAIVEYEKPSCTVAAYRELSNRKDELPVTIIGPGFKKNVTKKFKIYSLLKKEEKPKVVRHNSGDSIDSGADCDSEIFSSGSITSEDGKDDQSMSRCVSELLVVENVAGCCSEKDKRYKVEASSLARNLSNLCLKSEISGQTSNNVGVSVT